MSNKFIQDFRANGIISFTGMRDVAVQSLNQLSTHRQNVLHEELQRGKCILDDDDHLNAYIKAYGKMHREKLYEAFTNIPHIESLTQDEFEVYDWGCGQGTATICFLDYLKGKDACKKIRRITLIEPSTIAVARAKSVIGCYNLPANIEIRSICKGFDQLSEKELSNEYGKKIHLFSNILDVEAFDIVDFTDLFQRCFKGNNLFVCVGPYYYGNRRLEYFVAAVDPDVVFATLNREKGNWKNDWSISMRVFQKNYITIDSIESIRRRVIEVQKHQQFHAGYILDEVSDTLKSYNKADDAEILLKSLSSFDVRSNKPLNYPIEIDSKWAVVNNILTRGLPTIAPIKLQEIFSEAFHTSKLSDINAPSIHYGSNGTLDASALYKALHVIDPRFRVDEYNADMLGSDFEKSFITRTLLGSSCEHLIQLLEPQRPLSTIVRVPDQKFTKDQRVDFALEIPGNIDEDSPVGFVVELDGTIYHSNIFTRIKDENRDRYAANNKWETYRLTEGNHSSFVNEWAQSRSCIEYLRTIQENYTKHIEGDWAKILQLVLSPLAVARIEKTLIEAIITGALDVNAETWNIAVIERDVPCAAIGVENLLCTYEHLCLLDGTSFKRPNISLEIQSTPEFINSALHQGFAVNLELPDRQYDICIDISMLLRDNIDALSMNVSAETYYLIRSSHYKKQERTILTSRNIKYLPLTEKGLRGEYIELEDRKLNLTYFLQNIFRKRSFRTGQLPILSRTLSNNTTIGLLPTGGGKSLTYQLSSMLQPGVTIVVDPLISLMIDQYRGLGDIRIDAAACVNSSMHASEKTKNLALMQNGGVIFMLLSPERFMMQNFRDSLQAMSARNHVYFSYGVIDEVHCVSEWGHDFRPSYLHLGRNMINFMTTKDESPVAIIGLTATASFDVLADVERELTLGGNLTLDSDAIVRPENDTRDELTYKVINVEVGFDELRDRGEYYILNIDNDRPLKNRVSVAKRERIKSLLEEIPIDIQRRNREGVSTCAIPNYNIDDFYQPDINNKYPHAGIIFCPHAKGAFGVNDTIYDTYSIAGVATNLLANIRNLKIGTFVGGDKPSGDMVLFNGNDLNLMVATKAFGMGIDKPNVRYTINFNHPSSIESFVQEAGRGGRDRKNSISYLLYNSAEFIHLSIDNINDIAVYMGLSSFPEWLWNYRGKFILSNDFIDYLEYHGCTHAQAEGALEFCRQNNICENIDKNIELWFHNNSFRGLEKEKIILLEMTDRILNVKPRNILEVQEVLREDAGNDDLVLKLKTDKNAIVVISEEDNSKQYGFLFLDSLNAIYRFINFDEDSVCRPIMQKLIYILSQYPDHSAQWLGRPIDNIEINNDGIYAAISNSGTDKYTYVTVSWENSIEQDSEEYEKGIRDAITKIAQTEQWNMLDERQFGKFSLKYISTFDELLDCISRISNDPRWLIHHNQTAKYKLLRRAFYRKRDKDDTDKAIYRMCCIGLVDDVLIDYNLRTYQLKIHKRTDDEYLSCMLEFFKKYYSLEQAEKKVEDVQIHDGRNILDKCLGYLAEFVYSNLEAKRYRSIDDMRMACDEGMTKGEEWLKEFIHLYFNSKYAREDYKIEDEPYSLKRDTDRNSESYEVVRKYIRGISIDSSGSEVDNVKHLYGATLLVLRAHPENAALNILRTFCITFLGAGDNETLKHEALKGYVVDGFYRLNKELHVPSLQLFNLMNEFNTVLRRYVHKQDIYIKNEIIDSAKDLVMINIHKDWTDNFSKTYCR